MRPEPDKIRVLFEDGGLLAVDKPEGITSIPGRNQDGGSLLQLLQIRFPEKLFVVHRLDKGASGVILFAKTAEMHRRMNMLFENREVEKTYEALVHGRIDRDSGSVDQPLRAFGSGRMGADLLNGKPSVTAYRVLRRFQNHTWIEVSPKTGRRHQIRVHLYGMGHPIAGDLLYGEREKQKDYPRLMLHSRKICWKTPSGEMRTVEAELPESFRKVLDSISNSEE
jgi:tRNA pseudouridine32 synthase/23S rRNA pseudouridine746 synthase